MDAAPVVLIGVISVVGVDVKQPIVRIAVEVTTCIQAGVGGIEVPTTDHGSICTKSPYTIELCEGEFAPPRAPP